jgi:hypothetical protein
MLALGLALVMGGVLPEAGVAVPDDVPSLADALIAMPRTRKPAANLRTDLCFPVNPVLKEVLFIGTLHLLLSLPVQLKSIIHKPLSAAWTCAPTQFVV